jgi:hypothetical protein
MPCKAWVTIHDGEIDVVQTQDLIKGQPISHWFGSNVWAILHLPHHHHLTPLPPTIILPGSLSGLPTLRPEAPAGHPAPAPPPCISAQLPPVVMTVSQPDFAEK